VGTVRKSLYDRLPEIYHLRDAEQNPPYQLKAYLDILDTIQTAVHDSIDGLYHDLFIETCNDWVIPYIADLVGTSHLAGDPWTLRADVARTVHHRRRKGTLGAIESLTYALSGWAVHTVELRERLVWNQHLNHERPDEGGVPPTPLGIATVGHISGAVRGGTLTLRDPALLSFLNGPFDPFGHLVDVGPAVVGAIRHNLPNLAIFLWRLEGYRVPVTRPVLYDKDGIEIKDLTPAAVSGESKLFALRYDVHPLAEPMVLFNWRPDDSKANPSDLTNPDAVPGPMPWPRLNQGTVTGNPEAYAAIDLYGNDGPSATESSDVGLVLHLPEGTFGGVPWSWTWRGANLCAWEAGLNPPLQEHEIVIDPDHGRILFGIGGVDAVEADEAVPLRDGIYVSATYGFSGSSLGSSGAHPIARAELPVSSVEADHVRVPGELSLLQALDKACSTEETPLLIIEIEDSRIYELDLESVDGAINDGGWTLNLGRSLWICAASGQRPIIKLKKPLAFRPVDVTGAGAPALMENLDVTLEGLYITWDHESDVYGEAVYEAADPLINRAAVNQFKLDGCTLDPGSHEQLDGKRQKARYAFNLTKDYGFSNPGEVDAFDQTPRIIVRRSICGPMAIDDGYKLTLAGSIIDAAGGIGHTAPALAVHAATGDPETEWGPPLTVYYAEEGSPEKEDWGMTCFGRMRVESATGQGGIWVHSLKVHDDQVGCIKFSYFSGEDDRLPQHQGCVTAATAELSFASEVFGQAGYAQLRLRSDRKILEQGPRRDAMGAFGYLLNTHKWKNINIRYREFMPVGVRPILIPVT
jgi:hypothetical protein